MTACILDIGSWEDAESESVRASVALAVSVLKSRLEARGVPCVLAGGPYHPAERIASDPALARRLLHAGMEGGSTFLVLHIVGSASAELIDHVVRYLDAIAGPARPVVLLAHADVGMHPLAAALRAREALGARGRESSLTVWSTSNDADALTTISAAESTASASPAFKAWTTPLRSHIHARILGSPWTSAPWKLDSTNIREQLGMSVVDLVWTDVLQRANRSTTSMSDSVAGKAQELARALTDVLRETYAGSVTLPTVDRELESCLVNHLQSLPESPPYGLDGDDLGALSGLVLARALSDTPSLPFHAPGRRRVGSNVRCWRPLVEPCPFPPTLASFVRLVREPGGLRLLAVQGSPHDFYQRVRRGSWPTDRAHGAVGDHRASLELEARTLGIRFDVIDD